MNVTNADGVDYHWDPNSVVAGQRPQGLSFQTKRGEGFAEGSVTLARRIDQDYVDLNLFDDVSFIGDDGSIAYEGRVAAQPRSFSASHSISVQLAGWMAHARDRQFTEIYVDRDLSAWEMPSRARQAALMAANWSVFGFDATRDVSSAPALAMNIQGAWVSPYLPIVEAWYDAGPDNVVSSIHVWLRASAAATSATFDFRVFDGENDIAPSGSSSELWAGTDNVHVVPLPTARRFAIMQFLWPSTPAGADSVNFTMFASNLAVYGGQTTGLTVGDTTPYGVRASGVIGDIATRYCPKLNTNGVEQTDWPIPHLVFKEPTDPYDAFLAVNAYHLWELGVWENKTLTFAPANRLDHDWEVRLSDFGVEIELQGDSTEDLANGITVEYTNLMTGRKDSLSPVNYADLRDSDPDNPATKHGIEAWTQISLSNPTTYESALQIGRAALAEFNQPKSPGTINVMGHIRDRAGHWQQGWKVRAGDTIAITDHPNASPRLITETNWDHDQKQLRITVDSTAKRLDAVLDRLGTALTAAGLS